jgi:hypothetical protein
MTETDSRIKAVREKLIAARKAYKEVEAERNAIIVELSYTIPLNDLAKRFGMKPVAIIAVIGSTPPPKKDDITKDWVFE